MDAGCISFWEDDGSISIYLKKYGTVIRVNRNCELIEEYIVDDEGEEMIYREAYNVKKINGKTYISRGYLGYLFSYRNSVLECRDENGVRVLLYSHRLYQLLHDVGILAIGSFVIWLLVLRNVIEYVKLRRAAELDEHQEIPHLRRWI